MADELSRTYSQLLRKLRDGMYGTAEERAEVARRLAAYRPRAPHACIICGTVRIARPEARYCSAACRQRAYRARVTAARYGCEASE